MQRIIAAPQSALHAVWREAGGRAEGRWGELFGAYGGESLNAWTIAHYIDYIAEQGKAVYDLPLYANVWKGEQFFRLPGDYPSGGAVGRVLDIWKWSAPHLDLIAPDIYTQDSAGYREFCETYAREDNALFVPESASAGSNAWLMMYALATYGAIGYASFGVEHIMGPDGAVAPHAAPLVDSYRAVVEAIPLLLQYQGSDHIHAIVQEENQGEQFLDLDGWLGVATFGYGAPGHVGRDWRHAGGYPRFQADANTPRGRGLLFQASRNEFYLVGGAYQLHLCRKGSWQSMFSFTMLRDFHLDRQGHYVSVDEGHFDDRRRVCGRPAAQRR